MIVKALYFGGLRAALGRGEEELDLPEGSQVCVALARVLSGLGPDWAVALRCAVNEDFAPLDRVLMPGDEVAFLPPVAGGSPGAVWPQPHPAAKLPTFVPPRQPRDLLVLGSEPIQAGALLAGLDDPACGGLASFIGRVRREHLGREVLRLDYSAYEPMARRVLADLLRQARRRWALGPLALCHRLGTLQIGEVAVLVAVAGGHRGECFEACRWLIEAVKAEVPIWKHEWYGDGGEAWVGAPKVAVSA